MFPNRKRLLNYIEHGCCIIWLYFTFEEYLKINSFPRNDYVGFILGLLHIFCKIYHVSCSRPFIQGVGHYLANSSSNLFVCKLICSFATMDHPDISRLSVTRYPVAVLIYYFLPPDIKHRLIIHWLKHDIELKDAFMISNCIEK